jgi:hypothetical protein
MPLEKIWSEAIPSYIESVTLTIAKSNLTDDRRKELDKRFPGVVIKEGPGSQSLPGPDCSTKRQAAPDHPFEKPHGVKTAVFELQKDGTTRDEALETNIRKQYPWATIIPSINVPTSPKALPHSASLSTVNNLEHVGSSRVGRASSVDTSSEATVTPRTSRQLSLASRTSREHLSSVSHFTNDNLAQEIDLIGLARQLNMDPKRPDILWKMYERWRISGDIRTFQESDANIGYYYVNLVDLNILARGMNNSELEFATLLQFQITNFEQDEHLPDIYSAVIRTFKHLPIEAPLCRWIAIVFAYECNTIEGGDYDQFFRSNIDLDPVALCKFLYAVASVHEPHTKGGNKAVLQEWCTVHDHSLNSAEDTRCMNAERVCKNMVIESSPEKLNNTRKRLSKTRSGPKYDKKLKRNDVHQHGR